jgi:anti-anti-sigma factor
MTCQVGGLFQDQAAMQYFYEECVMAAIQVSDNEKSGIVTIAIRNRFDFCVHKEFRASYKDRETPAHYFINMREVNYIDSSALGMMLLLREHAMKHAGKVIIQNCKADIRKILTIANFERLFEIQ